MQWKLCTILLQALCNCTDDDDYYDENDVDDDDDADDDEQYSVFVWLHKYAGWPGSILVTKGSYFFFIPAG